MYPRVLPLRSSMSACSNRCVCEDIVDFERERPPSRAKARRGVRVFERVDTFFSPLFFVFADFTTVALLRTDDFLAVVFLWIAFFFFVKVVAFFTLRAGTPTVFLLLTETRVFFFLVLEIVIIKMNDEYYILIFHCALTYNSTLSIAYYAHLRACGDTL